MTRSSAFYFASGYSDCPNCGGSGVTFIEDDIAVSCPMCDVRDIEMQEVYGLDNDSYFSSEI